MLLMWKHHKVDANGMMAAHLWESTVPSDLKDALLDCDLLKLESHLSTEKPV